MSQSSPPPPSGADPLSARERVVLARVAAAEHAADPRFANDLAAGRVREPAGRAPRWVALGGVVIVVGVLVGFLTGPWFPLAVVVALLVAVPAGLIVWARRQERPGRR